MNGAHKANRAPQARQVPKACPDQLGREVHQAHREGTARLDLKASRGSLGATARLAQTAKMVCGVLMDCPVRWVQLVLRDHKGLRACRGETEMTVLQGHRVNRVWMAHLVRLAQTVRSARLGRVDQLVRMVKMVLQDLRESRG